MLPAAYGVGQGGEFRSPMAIAVIGGLLVSTVLSLVFIPSVYSVMDDVSRGISGLFRWLVHPNASDEADSADPHDVKSTVVGEEGRREAGEVMRIAAE
jgi:hypothetical protein